MRKVQALRSAKDALDEVIIAAATPIELGRELFAIADQLGESSSLRRAVTDPARSAEDRRALASHVFGTQISNEAARMLDILLGEHFSRDSDLLIALEELGVEAVLYTGKQEARLPEIEEQLYRCMRMLLRRRDLRVSLGERAIPAKHREDLARTVFTGLHPETLELLIRAVHRAPKPTVTASLNAYIEKVGQIGHHLVASVTSATALTDEQVARLTKILSDRYRTEVVVHISVEPRVVGGIRIHIGEDVIDGTLAHRLDAVKELITQ